MKKMLLVLCLFGLVSSSAIAKFCYNCGAEIIEKAKYCSSCGAKQQAKSDAVYKKQPSSPKIEIYTSKPKPKVEHVSYQTMKDKVVSLFTIVDKFGIQVRGFKYLNVVGSYPDYKVRLANSIRIFNHIRNRLPKELQILGMASIEKSSSFTTIIKIMRSFGVNFGYRDSIIKAAHVEINLYNEIINDIRKLQSPLGENEVELLEKKFINIEKKMRMLSVTSQYLKVGLDKIPRKTKIIVLSVEKKRAKILCIGESENREMIEGFVSLNSLEKRTSWQKKDLEIYK